MAGFQEIEVQSLSIKDQERISRSEEDTCMCSTEWKNLKMLKENVYVRVHFSNINLWLYQNGTLL